MEFFTVRGPTYSFAFCVFLVCLVGIMSCCYWCCKVLRDDNRLELFVRKSEMEEGPAESLLEHVKAATSFNLNALRQLPHLQHLNTLHIYIWPNISVTTSLCPSCLQCPAA